MNGEEFADALIKRLRPHVEGHMSKLAVDVVATLEAIFKDMQNDIERTMPNDDITRGIRAGLALSRAVCVSYIKDMTP